MTRVADEPCIVLHTRPYRESSLIVSLLSLNHGRFNVLAKGVRGGRRGRMLQSFTVLRAGWSGLSSLPTLTGFETLTQYWFKGAALASSFYMTELVVRLVGERDHHPRVFGGLKWALENIDQDLELTLRSFEKLLLEELGYGLDFNRDCEGQPLENQIRYEFVPERGFEAANEGYAGELLKMIGAENFQEPAVRKLAKKLFRQALAQQLGPKPLASRRLLVAPR